MAVWKIGPARWLALVLVLAFGLLAGCSRGGEDEAARSGGAETAAEEAGTQEDRADRAAPGVADEPAGDAGEGGGADSAAGGGAAGVLGARLDPVRRAIVHTVELTVEVEGSRELAAAARQAQRLAVAAGGYVEQESTTVDDDGASSTLVLRVPVDAHAAVVSDLEALGEVRNRYRSAQDVTDELVDVESRVASQRASLERLRALLDRAGSLSDVVALEAEIARREADLDSLLRRQEQLSGLAELATITLTLVRPGEVDAGGDDRGFLAGLRGGWRALVEVVQVGLTAVGAVLPFAAVALVVGLPLWRLLRGRRRAPVSTPASAPTTPE